MLDHADESTGPVVVLGGTGRVGTAVVDRLVQHGRPVVSVSRTPYDGTLPAGVQHRAGDVRDPRSLLRGVRPAGVVIAVTPFTSPPESFDGFDTDFYARIVDGLEATVDAGTRTVYVGVTAIARLTDGLLVADHEEYFPSRLRPFSDAHLRGVERLAASGLDGTVLIPSAGLSLDVVPTPAPPQLLPEPVGIEDALAGVDHACLALAVADRIGAARADAQRLVVRAAQN